MSEILDMRQVIALSLCILGVLFLAYALWRNRKSSSPLTRFLIGFSIFILVSASYAIEEHIQRWLGITAADQLALHFTDFIWWLSFAYLSTRVLDIALWRGLLTQNGKLLVPMILVHVVNIFVFAVIALIFTHNVLGKDITVLLTTSGFLLVALGYLAKEPFESAFAGLAIQLAPMFKKGDFVQIGDSYGTVQDIGWQYVALETREEDRLYIPNLKVREYVVINFTQTSPVFRHQLDITLEYSVPINKGRQIIERALDDLDETLEKYLVYAVRFTEFGVVYTIKFWVPDRFLYGDVVHMINSAIFYKLQKEIDADFGYNKFLSLNATRVSQKAVTMHEAFTKGTSLSLQQRIDLLRKVEIFSALDNTEIEMLASSCLVRMFGPPEKIIRQGDKGDSMFVIAKGQAKVYLQTGTHDTIELAIDKLGQYFGEMALLTGAERRATVRALDDVVLLEIPKAGMQIVLENRPSLAGEIATSIAEHQSQNEALLSAAHEKHQIDSAQRKSLAESIRINVQHFFGLKEKAGKQ